MEVHDAKRAQTLAAHSLDMARALAVFMGASLTVEDDRGDYAEARFSTIGFLEDARTWLIAVAGACATTAPLRPLDDP